MKKMEKSSSVDETLGKYVMMFAKILEIDLNSFDLLNLGINVIDQDPVRCIKN